MYSQMRPAPSKNLELFDSSNAFKKPANASACGQRQFRAEARFDRTRW